MIEIRIVAELVQQVLSDGVITPGGLTLTNGLPAGARLAEASVDPLRAELVLRFADGNEASTRLAPTITRHTEPS